MKTELFNFAYSINAQIENDKAHKKLDPMGYFKSTYPKMFMDNVTRAFNESSSKRQFNSLVKKYCKLTKSGIDDCEVCQYLVGKL